MRLVKVLIHVVDLRSSRRVCAYLHPNTGPPTPPHDSCITLPAGQVLIHGVDVRAMPLRALRAAVAVLPQSPFVATASLRHNLDPVAATADAVAGESAGQAAGSGACGKGRDRERGREGGAGAHACMGTGGRLGSGAGESQERERLSDGQLCGAGGRGRDRGGGEGNCAGGAVVQERLSDVQLVEALRRVGLWAALEAAAAHRRWGGGGPTGGDGGSAASGSGNSSNNSPAGDTEAALPAAGGSLTPATVTHEEVLSLPLGDTGTPLPAAGESLDPTTVKEVLSLPLGSQPGAVGLSAGQQQLLALARVLLRPRQLLLLDECSAHVDPATAAAVRSIVRQHVLGRAEQAGAGEGGGEVGCVVGAAACAVLEVAHDLGAVVGCDEVAVMEGGQVVERGAPGELLGRPGGAFRRLHAAGGHRPVTSAKL